MKHPELQLGRTKEVAATYFGCVMLSHKWEEREPLFGDINGNDVYNLDPVGGIMGLQSFCKIARAAGYRWAWSDTCCIDKTNQFEEQRSINSMFVWYRHSALTIVYLSDVPSKSIAQSAWIGRGWTIRESLGPRVLHFYRKDWTLYPADHSFNRK
ncbi:uncharacterized protein EDB91DRAFT_1063314 [Suillus paluster]|uniref:uncharacterized protein n=1 Tax=Suillus paluster TaxID=48578 RepID=UPI001B85D17D|nr:uncharacterized protein EDB91DRAFT_1063314 [Suillus paluster]KAG1723613.1 hypothetical protein EDB91DRAFT_1063314 [Suillus paluster]